MDTLIAEVIGCTTLVLIASSLFGAIARRFRQPAVAGQILVGVLIGPSFLGRLPGHLTELLFPHRVLPFLTVISQIAVAIFMFTVGYELDRKSFRQSCRPAVLVAAGALAVPFFLGSGSALLFKADLAGLGQARTGHSFALFMGVATSITALPVLASIVRERGLAGTTAGVTATTAAGIMDAAAWIVLAAALMGTSSGPGRPWLATLMLVSGFVVVMLLVVRPVLGRWIRHPRAVFTNQLPIALALTLGSAWVTASLGLHPVFGGLLAGLAMPGRGETPDAEVLRSMEEVSGMFLPLFFVVTGLSVNVSALPGQAFVVLAVLVAIATAGKGGPGYAASRLGGLDRKDAATVAVLVNTRGLTELIALDVGLRAHLIDQQIFSILVLMAVLSTIMTAPLLHLVRPRTTIRPARSPRPDTPAQCPGLAEPATRPGRETPV
jgi:Kef-type K+ transport system membrane component KefB